MADTAENDGLCGPCRRGQHACCDRSPFLSCACATCPIPPGEDDEKRPQAVSDEPTAEKDAPWVWGNGCECWVTPERMWTTHYGAVEPGSQIEFNPDCPMHGNTRPIPPGKEDRRG